jgi:hypothetical protein
MEERQKNKSVILWHTNFGKYRRISGRRITNQSMRWDMSLFMALICAMY